MSEIIKIKHTPNKNNVGKIMWQKSWLYVMLLPMVILYIVFKYIPMYGVILAFKEHNIFAGVMGSPWVGLDNFRHIFTGQAFYSVLRNTIVLSVLSLVVGFPGPILVALFLNEVRMPLFKKSIQSITYWLEMRWKFGFTEFYSNVYYNEDIAPVINLIDYCIDDEIVIKTTMIMDLMVYDYASQSYKGIFSTVSGRAYENHRKGGQSNSSMSVINHIFGFREDKPNKGLVYCFITRNNYTIPQVLIDIGNDTSDVTIKASNGINVCQLKEEGYYGIDERSNMMQWAMESFVNKEAVRNSMKYIRKNDLFTNGFLKPIKILNMLILRVLHLEPLVNIIINPQANGAAIQRGNTYTYKTKSYSMYTAQNYHPRIFGDQQHVQGVNIDEDIALFHVHPAVKDGGGGAMGNSPMYWVGYGHLPHCVQDENIKLAIYNTPKNKGLMEHSLLDFTHAYFPDDKLDETKIKGNYAFARKGDSYVAFITRNDLSFANDKNDDIIQQGKKVFWITQMGDKEEYKTFNAFIDKIMKNVVKFNDKKMTLMYQAHNVDYELCFKKDFKIDGEIIDLEYDRFNSPYIRSKRKAETFTFEYNEKSLFLDFYNMKRET